MTVHIPTPLRSYTDRQPTVEVSGTTVAESLEALVTAFPDLRGNLFGNDGKLRSFVNVYLNEDDIRYLPAREQTSTTGTDEITIIPSIAGGR